jgi:hypothetical protein
MPTTTTRATGRTTDSPGGPARHGWGHPPVIAQSHRFQLGTRAGLCPERSAVKSWSDAVRAAGLYRRGVDERHAPRSVKSDSSRTSPYARLAVSGGSRSAAGAVLRCRRGPPAGGGLPAPGQGAAALGRPGRGPCPGRRAANPHLDLRPDLTTVPLHGVEPSHVVPATRAGDHSRLVVAFRKSAQARVTAPSPAQAASAPPSRAGE